jgi:hypothetical protein
MSTHFKIFSLFVAIRWRYRHNRWLVIEGEGEM